MSIDVRTKRADSLSEQVAEEIRALLARRRVRQSQLARELGVSEQWISVRLRGVQPIDLNDLARIAEALHVPPGDLLPDSTRAGNGVTLRYREDTGRTRAHSTNGHRPTRANHHRDQPNADPPGPRGRVEPAGTAPRLRRPAVRPQRLAA